MFGILVAPVMLQSITQVYATPPVPWKEPGYLKVIWVDSPNLNDRPEGTIIDTVVVHHTANDSLEGTAKLFNTAESKVSAHFTIGKDGSIVQQVSTWKRAWHAGVSKDSQGRENVNNFSVGIELVNIGDGKNPYPDEQVNALYFLIEALKRRHPLKWITSHKLVAQPPGRKIDPIDFPWSRLAGVKLPIIP